MKAGVTINRPPRDGRMAFIRSPDNVSIELLQKGEVAAQERAVGVDAQHRQVVNAASSPTPASRRNLLKICSVERSGS